MNISTWAVVFATLLGPVLAVQAQRIIAQRGEEKQRKLWLFRTLMNTRIGTLTVEHVNALNAVPLEFHRDAVIMQKWRTYLDHLNTKMTALEVWGTKRLDLYNDLLAEMAKRLDYGFDPLQLKNEVYSPQGHAQLESDQEVIRRGIVGSAEGRGGAAAGREKHRPGPRDGEAHRRVAGSPDRVAGWQDGPQGEGRRPGVGLALAGRPRVRALSGMANHGPPLLRISWALTF